MKILHINTLDRGGAAQACIRLNQALNSLNCGIESDLMILSPTKKLPNVYKYNYWEGVGSRLTSLKKSLIKMMNERKERHLATTLPAHPGIFSFPNTIYDITETRLYKEADIIQLNWTHDFLDEPSFFEKNDKPVVWRMADLYITGGGPHYEVGFPYDTFSNIIQKNKQIREKALRHSHVNLTIAAISDWCKEKANNSELVKRFNKHVITCGIDLDFYKPIDKTLCRKILGLPIHKKIILFGVDTFIEERKGIKLLTEAFAMIKDPNVQIVTFGSGKLALPNIFSLGFVNDEKLLRIVYSAADIFVTSALEEAFGQTSIEAMACGLPLVSFKTGGALEIFKLNQNVGVLARNFTSIDLFEAINTALNTSFDTDKLIAHIHSNFNIIDKATQYADLYKSLI